MRELITAVSIIGYLVIGFLFWKWAKTKPWGAEMMEYKPFNYFFAFFCVGYWPIVLFIYAVIGGAVKILERGE